MHYSEDKPLTMKATTQQIELLDYCILQFSEPDISEEDMKKVIAVVKRVVEVTVGLNGDFVNLMAKVGENPVTIKKDLLEQTISFRNRLALFL